MSRDWFDPLGIRGTNLDPLKLLTDALRGRGPAQQSAQRLATAVAQALVGRPVHVEREPPVATRVEAVRELVPAAPLDGVPAIDGVIPLWRRFRARLGVVRIGDRELESAEIDVVDIKMVGASSPRVRMSRIEGVAVVDADRLAAWLADLDLPWEVRLDHGRLEVTDERVARWVGVEIRATARERTVTVETGDIRLLGRRFTPPPFLRRTVERAAPWLPALAEVHEVRVVEDRLEVRGAMTGVELPVDVVGLLTELTTSSTRTALRVMSGEW